MSELAAEKLNADLMATRLHEFFETQVDRRPDAVAVICGDQRLTYGELEDSANRLAHWLRALGIGPEVAVGLWLPRSAEVYVALLGILKAGGAYVPLDAEYPIERVAYIVADCRVPVLITTSALAAQLTSFAGTVLCVDRDWSTVATQSPRRLTAQEIDLRPEHLCYVIYTSGSTGKPKGVAVEHRNVCHLVGVERELYGAQPDDRVYQGFSIAFDASVEELWLAWATGGSLFAATRDLVHAGPDLPRMLTDAGVTILSCVPTLLSMMDGDLPTVRLLITGGEACSADLVRRWSHPGRRMMNTYGPTEATVIATATACVPGQPVTIGRPLPGYTAVILDEQQRHVLTGSPGELYLGGRALAREYINLSEMTAQKFLVLDQQDGQGPQRWYRTGDLARWTAAGDIDFLGRADGQVKLRGYRVELSEIDGALQSLPGVRAAAAAVHTDDRGTQDLVAYIVLRPNSTIDLEAWRVALRQQLPIYMIPVHFETLLQLPTLTSGKVDRKRLPPPVRPSRAVGTSDTLTPTEERLAQVWGNVFGLPSVTRIDHFFLDLGGHSLLAARMVSELRRVPQYASLSMHDVYQHPTIAQLGVILDERTEHTAPDDNASSPTAWRVSWGQHALCGAGQFLALYFIAGIFSLQWLAPFVGYSWMVDDEFPVIDGVLVALGALAAVYPTMVLTTILAKWLILGRVRAGRYPVWGTFYLRWWIVDTLRNVTPTGYLAGTPLLNLYYRLLGAAIGPNVYLGSDAARVVDLLSIGADTCIGTDVSFSGCTVVDGWLVIGPVSLGERCTVGNRSVLGVGARMENDSELDDLSLLPPHTVLPEGRRFRGSPARDCGASVTESIVRPSWCRRFLFGLAACVGVILIEMLVLAAIFPGMMAMAHLNQHDDYYWYLVVSPAIAITFLVLLALEIVAVKWLLLGRIQPGRTPLYTSFHYRKWFYDHLMQLSLDVMGPLYSTLYLSPWYRLLGAKVGRLTEVSTAADLAPDLLEMGDECFVADAVSLGAARIHHGTITLDRVHLGARTFIGNSALLPVGTTIGDNCLIGCLSTPPHDAAANLGTSWLGSPAFFLPQRQHATAAFAESQTFRPPPRLIALRLLIEFFRVTLPGTCFIILTNVLLSAVVVWREEFTDLQMALLFPIFYELAALAALLTFVVFKWTVMGRYRPQEQPLWSVFVWRTEVVTAMLDHFAAPYLLGSLKGTPFLSWFFRLLGANIGKRVYLDTAELTEFDLVEIGDFASLNNDATLQTHLFEDRIMKMSHVRVGVGANIGSMSLVLYDTKMEPGSSLGELSLLMKGETLPARTAWAGIPARPAIAPVRSSPADPRPAPCKYRVGR